MVREDVESLVAWCRKEAARNAQMQGDRQHTSQRRKTFRHRNHQLLKVASALEDALDLTLDKP